MDDDLQHMFVPAVALACRCPVHDGRRVARRGVPARFSDRFRANPGHRLA